MASIVGYGLAVFVILHGFVHFWYVVLSQGWVEMEDAMGWNGRSWLLSGTVSTERLLGVASLLYVGVAIGFAVAAVGFLLSTPWWRPTLAGSALLSILVIVGMWDGRPDRLVEKGLIGVAIDVGLLAWALGAA